MDIFIKALLWTAGILCGIVAAPIALALALCILVLGVFLICLIGGGLYYAVYAVYLTVKYKITRWKLARKIAKERKKNVIEIKRRA